MARREVWAEATRRKESHTGLGRKSPSYRSSQAPRVRARGRLPEPLDGPSTAAGPPCRTKHTSGGFHGLPRTDGETQRVSAPAERSLRLQSSHGGGRPKGGAAGPQARRSRPRRGTSRLAPSHTSRREPPPRPTGATAVRGPHLLVTLSGLRVPKPATFPPASLP